MLVVAQFLLAVFRAVIGITSMRVDRRRSRGSLEIGIGRPFQLSSFHSMVRLGTAAEERYSTLGPLDIDQGDHNCNPVEAVAEDCSDGSVVVPTKDGVEDLPTTVGTDGSGFRVSVGQVPNVASDLVGSWAVAGLGDVSSDGLGESLQTSGK